MRLHLPACARIYSVVLAGCLFFQSAPSLADPSRVVIVRPVGRAPSLEDAVVRLRAELTQAGFEVVVKRGHSADARAEVERGAKDKIAFATVTLAPIARRRGHSDAAADIWIADHVTGKTVVRRLDVGLASPNHRASILAIRAAELLRASLREAEVAPAAKESVPHEGTHFARRELPLDVADWLVRNAPPERSAPPASAEPPSSGASQSAPAPVATAQKEKEQIATEARKHGGKYTTSPCPGASVANSGCESPAKRQSQPSIRYRFSIESAIGMLSSPVAIPAAMGPTIRFGVEVIPNVSLRVGFTGLAVGADLETASATARTRQEFGAVELLYTFRKESDRVRPFVFAGLGGYHLYLHASPKRSAQGGSMHVVSGAADAGVGVSVRWTDRVSVGLNGYAAGLQLAPKIDLLGEEVGTVGRPLVGASLGLRYRF